MEQAFTRKWHSDLALEGKSDFLRQGRVIKGKEWQIRCGWGLGEWGEVEIHRAGAEAVGCPKLQSKNFKLYANRPVLSNTGATTHMWLFSLKCG